ncbi:MAG: exodeoxyribonuclease VII small subunit [Betaproteobacteria bacterium]|nr:exodeoxyribonuclease VII small subunit [Betaproteobacteria bacterium]
MTHLANTSPASFESAMRELERLVGEMESGQLTLEQSLLAYQNGAELLKFCQNTLDSARQQVEILENTLLKPYIPVSVQRDD